MYIINVTGHRPNKLGGYRYCVMHQRVKEAIRVKLLAARHKHGDILGVWGGALGVDQWFAAICNDLDVPHVLFVPFKGFYHRWPEQSIKTFQELAQTTSLESLSEVAKRPSKALQGSEWSTEAGIVVVETNNPHSYGEVAQAMNRRNHAMIDVSDAQLAVWDGSNGGTGNAVAYAKKVNRPIAYINPKGDMPKEITDEEAMNAIEWLIANAKPDGPGGGFNMELWDDIGCIDFDKLGPWAQDKGMIVHNYAKQGGNLHWLLHEYDPDIPLKYNTQGGRK